MSKPRNPRYFPRMKVRGARRRQKAPWERMAGGFEGFALTMGLGANGMNQYAFRLRQLFGTQIRENGVFKLTKDH